mmetsp:Transcript_121784/g.171342  ORF Transcript_121784/g.171342 Transcript_121784/m.171342 type:complete len:574 (-) Transcript_121784:37-1758(-)
MAEAETTKLTADEVPAYNATAPSRNDAASDAADASESHGWPFPLEPFRFIGDLAPSKYKYVPTYVKVIHSVPHLVLLTGTGADLALLARILMEYRNWYNVTHTNLEICVLILCFSYGLFCLQHFFKHLVEYSADLQTRSIRLQASRSQVSETFNDTVTEMDSMLNKSADTQASLAERGLDSHRRDFHTFLLKGMVRKLAGSTIEVSPESFISFIVQYLAIFEECAVDPIHEPYILATQEELRAKCASAAEVAELVGNRAKAKEVRFLGNHVEEAKKKASGLRQKWKKVTHVPRKVLRLTGLGRWVKRRKNPKTGDEEEGSFGTFSHDGVAEPRELKWFRIDIGCGIGIETAGDEEEGSFPVQIHGLLFSCTVLSPEHVQLLVSIVTGMPLLILSCVAVREYSRALTCSIAVALLCTSFVLYDFLEIDAVQRMEIQIQEMQAAVAMVQQRRERMLEFFGKLHQLADLWLYRTLPRLEFMKLLSESLQDAEDADMAKHLQDIVAKVGILEDSLMPLSAWESDQLSRETKKGLADSITRLTRSSANDALEQVPTLSKEMSEIKIRLLAAPPQGVEA